MDFKETYREAEALFDEGNYQEAEPLLREIIKRNPGYPDVLNKLGVISSLKGSMKEAAGYFELALKQNPNYTEASLNLAITYNEMNEFIKARDIFAKAAQIAHPSPAALDPFVRGKLANEHFKLGNKYMDYALYEEAIEEYKKALRLRRDLVDVRTRLGIAFRNKEMFDEAVSQFTMAKELNPAYGTAWVQLGLTYYMQGLTGLAIEEWETALRQNPGLKEARTYLKLLREKEQS